MAANKIILLGPTAIATTNGILYSPPTLTGGTNPPPNSTNSFYILRHIRVTNRTAGALTFGLFLAANTNGTAGTEFIWACTATGGPPPTAITASTGQNVPAQAFVEAFGLWRIASNDTALDLCGIASAAGLVIEAEGEIGVV